MKRLFAISMLFLAVLAHGQFITITGTVADSLGHPYANGSGRVVLVPQAVNWLINGTNPVASPVVISGLDSFGKFSISLPSTSVIAPASSNPQWQFSFTNQSCPNQPIAASFTMTPLSLTSSQDISTTIQAQAAPSLCIGSGSSSLPIYLNTGTPTSQGNECASVTTDSSGGAVTAVAAFRVIVGTVGHDAACVVTVDAANPTDIGSLVWTGINSFSPDSAATQLAPGIVEAVSTGQPSFITTNNSGTIRSQSWNMRGCNSPGASCGTDLSFTEDPTNAGKEEFYLTLGGDGTPLYIGDVLNSTHPGIWMGGQGAQVSAVFGIDRVLGKSSHIGRLADDPDVWDTVTLSSGSATVTFNRAFASTPLCFVTWQSATLSGPLECTPTTSGLTISSPAAKLRCESGLGDGLNAVPAATYLQSFCYNDSGVTWTITGIKCYTDNSGSSTLNATNGGGTGLLTGPISCSSSFASGSPSATTTIANGDFIKFSFAADGSSKQTTWVVSLAESSDNAVVSYLVLGNPN
jgi:hypothetical protein